MPTYEVTLTNFSFPTTLDRRSANFRMVLSLRYLEAQGKPSSASTVAPSADSHWDCDWTKADGPNYVGPTPPAPQALGAFLAAAANMPPASGAPSAAQTTTILAVVSRPNNYGQFDMSRISAYDRTLAIVAGSTLHSLQAVVFDVDREDLGDKILAGLSKVVSGAIGHFAKQLPSGLSLPDSLETLIATKIAGPGDRRITTFTHRFTPADNAAAATPQGWSTNLVSQVALAGKDGSEEGYGGDYTLGLRIGPA